jgi:hypothetical protein
VQRGLEHKSSFIEAILYAHAGMGFSREETLGYRESIAF